MLNVEIELIDSSACRLPDMSGNGADTSESVFAGPTIYAATFSSFGAHEVVYQDLK